MPFITLAERFEQSSTKLYSFIPPSSRDSNRQPYVFILPNSRQAQSRILDDTRSLPIVSTIRDTERIKKFLKSSQGTRFLATQQVLQTGNIFVNTKIFNPASILANTAPFLHVKRHIDPTGFIRQIVPGYLQNNTVDDVASKFPLPPVQLGGGTLVSQLNAAAGRYISGAINKFTRSITGSIRRAVGNTLFISQTFNTSRPEYQVFYTKRTESTYSGPYLVQKQPASSMGDVKRLVSSFIATGKVSKRVVRDVAAAAAVRFVSKAIRKAVSNDTPKDPTNSRDKEFDKTFVDAAKVFRQRFYGRPENPNNGRLYSQYLTERIINDPSVNIVQSVTEGRTKLSDPFNSARYVDAIAEYAITNNPKIYTPQDQSTARITLPPTTITEQPDKKDIINFQFQPVNGAALVFRAFISSLNETITPNFQSQYYVGRTERFVTYEGTTRACDIVFNIVAFSESEMDYVWKRVNFLTGLAFPLGVTTSGFMVPPMFKINIGGIYDQQPAYIESLAHKFIDPQYTTFDIDKEVPFMIEVTMRASLLEKRSKYQRSPFYKIVEKADETFIQELNRLIADPDQFRRVSDEINTGRRIP